MRTWIVKQREAIKLIVSIVKNERKSLTRYVFFVCIMAGVQAFMPYIAKLEIDQLVQKNTSFFHISLQDPYFVFVVIVGLIGIVNIWDAVITKIQEYYQKIYSSAVEEKYLFSLIVRLRDIRLGMYLNKRNQKFIASFWTGDCMSAIQSLVVDSILTNTIRVAGIIVVFSHLHIQLLGLVTLTVGIWFVLDRREKAYIQKQQLLAKYTYDQKLRDMTRHLTDSFDKIAISGGYQFCIDTVRALKQEKMDKSHHHHLRSLKFAGWSYGNLQLGEMAVKLLIGYAIIRTGSSVGVLTMTLLYIGQLKSFFRAMFSVQEKVGVVVDEVQRLQLYLVMTTPSSIGNKSLQTPIENIQINNVSFAYPGVSGEELDAYRIMIRRLEKYGARKANERVKDTIHYMNDAFQESMRAPNTILDGINLTLEKGKAYGIVGENGAGKTTLMHVLMGYFPGYTGGISYNNMDLKTINPRSYDDMFGVITQEPFLLYTCTIRENILMGVSKSYTDDELYVYLEKFNLAKKVRSMRKKLDSNIGYDGDFSGGQKQLLVLIRVILQDRPVLIVDEGTNQLDVENEGRIMEYLMQNRKDKIIVFITHKITTMKFADEIICISLGRVVGKGDHVSLLQGDNLYRRFWERQVGGALSEQAPL